jgi:deoxycytidine triphosphate deaminase
MADQGAPQQDTPRTASDGFATTDEEARKGFERWKAEDPFPDIEPALLNSGDVADYVAATGMIYPFHVDNDKRKPASYEVDLLGRCVSFSGDRREDVLVTDVARGDEFILRRNEIAFVQLEPNFRLPEYIALRFNLRITNVYRGLLLGTGPLVDPGFEGHLWIPLHNLTANDYVLRGGEGLVWMEFTKLSPVLTQRDRGKRQQYFMPFPEEKNRRSDIMDYLQAADPHRPIRSSIPPLVGRARQDAADAAESAEGARRLIRTITLVGVAAIAAIVIATFQLVDGVRDHAEEAFRKADRLESQVRVLEDELGRVKSNANASNRSGRSK